MEPIRPARSPWLSRWDLVPLAAAGLLLFALPALMRGLPDPIPTHFDAEGRPDGWMAKAIYPWFALGLPTGIWLLVLLSGLAFRGTGQDPEGRKAEAVAPLRGLVAAGLFGMMGVSLLIPRFGPSLLAWMISGFLGLVLLGTILMVRSMKRLFPEGLSTQHYRWGLFYVNPEDPRLWVPKRMGLGWTLNFARGGSWLVLGLLILPPLLVILLLGRVR